MPVRTVHVREAELDSLDWDELRGSAAQVCIGDAQARVVAVHLDWNWAWKQGQGKET